uniref:Ubiquinone/menaquinone biosynthesis C-methyltransferase UbiE-like n=1 Tax=Ciona intestinalis TaxID=7719 RepID=H2XT31_CIOIN|nr:uncharacterized protein LOC101242218 isoform X1 [Ciona intestinalis]XP_026693696.1 uncharacterized protein LOC101242218 isoform X1 [Ciona intestinalis]|eukprot:XP_004226988.1 uncharacterized protein LOC101242218 isoform X1 [Ciona intestinalis]
MSLNSSSDANVARDAFQRINTYVKPNDLSETDKFYTSWVETYDADYSVVDYKPHARMASTLTASVNDEDKRNEKFCVLDIASGTGNCAQTLRNNGFKWTIDGIEGNAAMNEKAKAKNLYRNLKVEYVTPNERMTYDDDSYDVIVSIGGFSRTHIQPECIKEVLRILKPGGLFWFSVRKSDAAESYNATVYAILTDLVHKNLVKILAREEMDYYGCKFDKTIQKQGYERCVRKI